MQSKHGIPRQNNQSCPSKYETNPSANGGIMYNYKIRKNMGLKIEGIIYNWDDRIPYILVRVINAITLSTNETELRQAIKYIASKTELEKFFAYGYGAHHFWLTHRRLSNGKPINHRLLIVEF